MIPPIKVTLFAAFALPVLALAQQQPTPVPKGQNLLSNGDFAQYTDEDNLWDGVDREGLLSGDVLGEDANSKSNTPGGKGIFYAKGSNAVEAVREGGEVARLPMPLSVQVADFNKDGLLDLITVDPRGYFRVYFNSGSPTEPTFTNAEVVPLFLGRFTWPAPAKGQWWRNYGDGLKLALGDFEKTGTQDLVLGNYYGDMMLVKNSGSVQVPEWRQPGSIDSVKLPTTRDGRLWSNLLAPATYDWNKDGKLDILVGEGSYSANAIHLLINATGMVSGGGSGFVGSNGFSSGGKTSMPNFNEDMREYLVYGDGLEQLAPAVVDYNGDGIPDLLVADRTGQIGVYLSDGAWKKGVELKRQPQPISFGGVTSIGQGSASLRCLAPTVGDLNGDGKFDIIVGKPDGHIAVSYNIGTSTEPKFGPLADLKGTKVFPRGSIRAPIGWGVGFGYGRGNFLSYYTVVKPEEDPEVAQATGKNVLKFGYLPCQNKVIKKPPMVLYDDNVQPAGNPWAGFNRDGISPVYWGDGYYRSGGFTDSNTLGITKEPGWNVVKPNVHYTLSFRVKGRNVRKAHLYFLFGGWLLRDIESAKQVNSPGDSRASEAMMTEFDFPVTPVWTVVSRPITFKFNSQPDLNAPEKWNKPGSKISYLSRIDIKAVLGVDDSVFYIDDIKLVEM